MGRYGVIDIGSNTIRLVVYDVRELDPETEGEALGELDARIATPGFEDVEFDYVLDESVIAGLSAYISDGSMTDEGIDKACEALDRLEQRAHVVSCDSIHPFATAAIRNCTNRDEVVSRIEERTGLRIDVLDGEEEAALGFAGASIGMDMGNGALIDLGGGSAEVTVIEDGADIFSSSIPMGCVAAYSRFVSMVFPTPDECDAIRAAFEELLDAADVLGYAPRPVLYGLGGGTASVSMMRATMDGGRAPSEHITLDDVRTIMRLLADDPSTFAHTATKAVPSTMHMLVPACIVYEVLMEAFGADTLIPCRFGIREGYLREKVL